MMLNIARRSKAWWKRDRVLLLLLSFNFVHAFVVVHPQKQQSSSLGSTTKKLESESQDLSTARNFGQALRQLTSSSRVADAGPAADNLWRQHCKTSQTTTKHSAAALFHVVTLNKILACYSKSVAAQSSQSAKLQLAQAAEAFLEDWQQHSAAAEKPDCVSYNTLMAIWARTGQAERAEQVFDQLLLQKSSHLHPDAVSHSTLLHAHAVAGNSERVRALFGQMPHPTIHSYNNVLYAYSRSEHLTAAEEFLEWWKKQEEAECRPDVTSHNIVLHAFCAQQVNRRTLLRAEAFLDSMPERDAISYTTLIATCCRLPGNLALEAVKRVLERAWDDDGVVVDSKFLSNVIYSLAKITGSRDAPIFADDLVATALQRGVLLQDIHVYNALIYCWSRSGDRKAGLRVLSLLSQLEADGPQPDIKTYTNVLNTLKNRGTESVQVAESILQRMELHGPAPNVQAYTALMQNYARSKLPFKAPKTCQVLLRMQRRGIEPSVVSYNAVLNACEYTDPNDQVVVEEALKVACVVFDEIRSNRHIRPNHVTYGSFLGVIANLMPRTSRQEIVEVVFRRCCLEGQVSRFVLQKLREAAIGDLYSQLLKGHSDNHLPKEWTCHVRETRARHES